MIRNRMMIFIFTFYVIGNAWATPTPGKIPVTQSVTVNQQGSSIVNIHDSDITDNLGSNVLIGVPNVGIGTTDVSNGYVVLGGTRTSNLLLHTLRDQSVINFPSSGSAYADLDIESTMTGSSTYDHYTAIQARPIYSGSGGITTRFDTIFSEAVQNGPGTVAIGRGLHISDFGGLGAITNDYGIYVDNISRGSNNYSIFTSGGPHLLGGNVTIQTSTAGQPLNIVYPANAQNTSLNPAFQLQSNDGSGYFALNATMQGGTVQDNRIFTLQTSQNGGTSAGTIALNPSGGNVTVGLYGVPSNSLTIGYPASKTFTGLSFPLQIQSNDASHYFALEEYMAGGASQSGRSFQMQTVEQGVANAGSIILQPAGGNVGIGTNSALGQLQVNNAAAHAGQGTCWTTNGVIGYCTTAMSAGGACTCTGL